MEQYKIIKGFENYSVSNFGRVRNNATDKILKPIIDVHGYYIVSLRSDGNTYTKKIHKLVAECFIDNPYNKTCVDHIDNCKTNNNIANLRWVTLKENQKNRKLNSNSTSN